MGSPILGVEHNEIMASNGLFNLVEIHAMFVEIVVVLTVHPALDSLAVEGSSSFPQRFAG